MAPTSAMRTGRSGPCLLRVPRTASISMPMPWPSIMRPSRSRRSCPKAFSATTRFTSQFPGRNPAKPAGCRRNSLATAPCRSPELYCYLALDFWRWLARFEKNWRVRNVSLDRLPLQRSLSTSRLGTHIAENITLPVEARNKHGPPVLFTDGLVRGNCGRLISFRGHIAERFAEATLTELVGAAEELHGIVHAEWSQQELHGSVMRVAQGQDVAPHGGSLASPAKQNRRT